MSRAMAVLRQPNDARACAGVRLELAGVIVMALVIASLGLQILEK